MPDPQQYTDVNGKPVETRQFFDVNGKPLDLSKSPYVNRPQASPREIQDLKDSKPLPVSQSTLIGREVPGILTTMGAMGGGVVGGFPGAVVGATGGSALGEYLKNKVGGMGEKSTNPYDATFNVILRAGENLIPEGLSGVLSAVRGVASDSGKAAILSKIFKNQATPEEIQAMRETVQAHPDYPFNYSQVSKNPSAASFETSLSNGPSRINLTSQNKTNLKDLSQFQKPMSNTLDSAASKNSDLFDSVSTKYDNLYKVDPKSADKYLKEQFATKFNTQEASLINALNKSDRNSSTYKGVASLALNDAKNAERFIAATGDRQTMADLALNKLAKIGTNNDTGVIDPGKILNELRQNDDLYKIAIPSQVRSNFAELVKRIDVNQPTISSNLTNSVLRRGESGLILSLPIDVALAATGHVSTGEAVVGAGTAIGMKIGLSSIAKLMTNPQVARAALELTRTPVGTPRATLLSNIFVKGALKAGINLSTPEDPEKTQ